MSTTDKPACAICGKGREALKWDGFTFEPHDSRREIVITLHNAASPSDVFEMRLAIAPTDPRDAKLQTSENERRSPFPGDILQGSLEELRLAEPYSLKPDDPSGGPRIVAMCGTLLPPDDFHKRPYKARVVKVGGHLLLRDAGGVNVMMKMPIAHVEFP